jgi:TPR repeat protein
MPPSRHPFPFRLLGSILFLIAPTVLLFAADAPDAVQATQKPAAPPANPLAGLASLTRPDNLQPPAASFWDDAIKGSPDAAYRLALCYMKGQGVPPDPAQVELWLDRAAAEKSLPAMRMLGDIYANGLLGHSVDLVTARSWYDEGANAGDFPSETSYADMLLKGNGGDQDEAEGFNWLLAAGTNADQPAAAMLAQIYAYGQGTLPRNQRLAYIWSLLASSFTEPDPQRASKNADLMVQNAKLQQSLPASLPPDDVVWLKNRADALNKYQIKFGSPIVDDAPDETVTLPPEGTSGRTPSNSTLIKVMVNFDGHQAHSMMIDTGCCFSNIGSGLAHKLGLVQVGETSYDTAHFSRILAANGRIFGARFKNLRFVEVPWPSDFNRKGIEGILGGNFIRLLRIKYSFKDHIVTLEPPGLDARVGLPLVFSQATPNTDATIESADHERFTVSALLDTGNWGGVIMDADLNRSHPFGQLVSDVVTESFEGSDGHRDVKTGRLSSVSIGSFQVDKPSLTYEDAHSGSNWPELNVGMLVMRNFSIAFDYQNSMLYLEPRDDELSETPPNLDPHIPARSSP